MLVFAVQAMMKSPAVKKIEPVIIGSRRSSGMALPPVAITFFLYTAAPAARTTPPKMTPMMIAVNGTVDTISFQPRRTANSYWIAGTALEV